ncbi:ALG6, ALG8 glycosyltransferase family protein [Besnoitia besnoiti]|uniref:dolichyl-P-Glc:Glc1Man9GlcNAc2-PP-dolichol alpha-1,3-glucosyltransferase n=1 Tax=Besnoitia besnoiti TaxID=94643 RepID=A0A2A9M7E5_BESBE|nr:ALG6, ALG8 glycosyltransferase family protein [Besnoitia besnoiti]PFH34398.1 ALG6, ALG8 glycosyltransferase family protein [Besnoitia besnoiti]
MKGSTCERRETANGAAWPWVVAAATALKILLIPAYRSTDFEVHRNWLAITASQPLSTWYRPESSPSKWTLDYPPLFAFFEFFLSLFARFIDPAMLQVENQDYASPSCVRFQRFTVVATDLVLVVGVWRMYTAAQALRREETRPPRFGSRCQDAHSGVCRKEDETGSTEECGEKGEEEARENDGWPAVALLLVLFNAGLLIVDHIHFQYNGFLLGVLFLSIADIQTGRYYRGSTLFTALLLLKHIFLYVAPVYFVFLLSWLRSHGAAPAPAEHSGTEADEAFTSGDARQFSASASSSSPRRLSLRGSVASWLARVAKLAALLIAFSLLVLAPFVTTGQLRDLLSRLFPFGRGLLHAQWSANVWALYAAADRLLLLAREKLTRVSLAALDAPCGPTRGLVGAGAFQVLPSVSPAAAATVTLVLYTPLLAAVWRAPSRRLFPVYVALGGSVCFATGWHVHEKAIFLVSLPLGVAAWMDLNPLLLVVSFLLNALSNLAILPLLPRAHETPLKLTIFLFATLLEAICLFLALEEVKRRARRDTPMHAGASAQLVDGVLTSPVPCSWPWLGGPPPSSARVAASCVSRQTQAPRSPPCACFSFLCALEANCVAAAGGARPALLRKLVRCYFLFLTLCLASVGVLYGLQSDVVPNLLLLQLYKTEMSSAAAETSLSSPAPVGTLAPSGPLRPGAAEEALEDADALASSRLTARGVLALILHYHGAARAEDHRQRAAARQFLSELVLSPGSMPAAPSAASHSAAPEEEQKGKRERPSRVEGEAHKVAGGGESEEGVEMNRVHGVWGPDAPQLRSIFHKWREALASPVYQTLFRAHRVVKRFEFLPLLLLVCACAVGLLSLFVVLHVHIVCCLAPLARGSLVAPAETHDAF